MNDLIDNVRIWGEIRVKGVDINARSTDVIEIRRRVGMVFQKSNPFPKSIYENVVYGLRIAGINDKATLDEACERSLRGAALWDEVKDRLDESGARALGRPAAAAVHRARDRRRARGDPDGRALLGARPHRDAQDRGADLPAEGEVHDRDRDPQHAAGGARLGQDRVLLAGAAGGVRPDARTSSRPRRTSSPRTTSRAASARTEESGDAWNGIISRRSCRAQEPAAHDGRPGRGARTPRHPVADPPQGGGGAPHHRHRQGDQRSPDRHRRPLPQAARDAGAARDRPQADHLGDEDQRRPGARRRPGRQHRRERRWCCCRTRR